MKLYEEILLLQGYFKGKYCVENVISWYKPLIYPQKLGRHYYWCNFALKNIKNIKPSQIVNGLIKTKELLHNIDLSKYTGIDKDLALSNCVESDVANDILLCAIKQRQKMLI